MEMKAKGGIFYHLLYWSFVSQFSLRLIQCLPWEGEGQVPNGEGTFSGVKKEFFSVKTDFSLAPVLQYCLNQTQKETELSLLVVFFKLFPKNPVPSQGLCSLKCSFLFRVWVRAGAGKMWQRCYVDVHLCISWLSGCVLHRGATSKVSSWR